MASPFPITTPRLTVRIMRVSDAEVFAAYRNDPAVARHQLWDLPYTLDRARQDLADQDERDDVAPGEWTQLAIELNGTVIGDVCCHLDPTGSVAEIGYTLATPFQGKGFATEAARAMADDLVERVGVVRLFGELDPANIASQRVLENLGLTFESHTRLSFLWRGEWTDNMTYGATAQDYRAWRDRPLTPPDDVRLISLTTQNVQQYRRLATHHSQQRFVAPMLDSFTDALFPEDVDGAPVQPVMWGIEADGEAAGFVMIADVTPAHPVPYLWRLLIDRRHQRRGIGLRALEDLIGQMRAAGHAELLVSWVEGSGTPAPFYRRRGFELTGRIVDGEVEGRLPLTS